MKDFLKRAKLNESNLSMLLGVVVVVIVASLLINYFRSVNQPGDTSSTTTETESVTPTGTPALSDLPAEYTVAAGESLWKISEKVYGTGYNWSDVYEANREVLGSNPNVLLADTKITLPKVEPIMPAGTATATIPVEYTVEAGDHLWGIAIKVCQNGFVWPQIAQRNQIANPNLIEVGQMLTVVCQ